VRFNVPSVGSSISFESALAQAIAVSLFTTGLLHAPSFQPALATRLAAALDAYLDLPDWRALLAGAGSEEGLVLMYDLAGMPRPAQGIALPDSWLPLADVPAQTDDSASVTQADVAQLVELAERMGARSLLIMADNLSAPRRAIEDISAWAASIWAWQGSTSCVKVQLYAPMAAQQAIEAVIGVHPSAAIRWDEQALRAMLERRLRVASDGAVSDLQSLGWHEQDQTDMVEQAGGSPRRLIALIRDALAVQAEHVSFQPARKPAHAPATVNQDNAGVYLKTAAEVSRPQAIAVSHPRVLPKNMTGWMS
jgi:hypothetical protein